MLRIVHGGGAARLQVLDLAELDRLRPKLDVVADEQVQTAVVVVVAEGAGGAPGLRRDARLFRHVAKAPRPRLLPRARLVVQQRAPAIGREVHVDEAVAVIVPHGHTHPPLRGQRGEARFSRHVPELAVAVPLVEGYVLRGKQHVQVAVVVVVQEAASAAHGLQDVDGPLARNAVPEVDTGARRDVGELRVRGRGGRRAARRCRRGMGASGQRRERQQGQERSTGRHRALPIAASPAWPSPRPARA